MSFLNNRWAPLAAFLILAVAVAYLFVTQRSVNEEAIYKAQSRSCQRLNDVIQESNNRVPKHQLDTDVLKQFLMDAATAREASGTKLDKDTAEKYRKSAAELGQLKFEFVQSIDCNKVIPRP